ncbi:MAG: putative lipid II flippase FtsW [Gammaproteobacteria bacterium]|nr:putative lipid II flippase FtsW [Gammaproteobacteria bacterium]
MFRSRTQNREVITVSDYDSPIDPGLLMALVGIALFGVVLITSSSMPFSEKLYGDPFYFARRQIIVLAMGFVGAVLLFRVPLARWEQFGPALVIISLFFLLLVLVPGIGREVNGSRRWIDLGFITLQVSEAVKLCIIVYLSGYLVRRGELVQTTLGGFLNPLLLIMVASALLLAEPDFGAAVVIVMTAMLMLFIAGVRLHQFVALVSGLALVGYLLIWTSEYRLQRFASFRNPWEDPFGSGFQLSQSLIAIGSGSWSGVGLGNSVQKLFYLPEAHTDFVYAIAAEELGLIGSALIIGLFVFIVWRCFQLAWRADALGMRFAGFVALGIGIWIGLQSFINIGVNMGVLPTKGITLPMMSYGGSSALIFSFSFAILLRVDYEVRLRALETLKPSRSRDSGGQSGG